MNGGDRPDREGVKVLMWGPDDADPHDDHDDGEGEGDENN